MTPAASRFGWYRAHRYAVLFYTLLGSVVLPPLLRLAGEGFELMEAFLALNLVLAVTALERGTVRNLALVAIVLALPLRPGAALLQADTVSAASLLAWGVVALVAAASALVFSLRGREVGTEQVYAALSAYLLAGLFYGVLFWVLGQLQPGALSVAGDATPEALRVSTAVYYSFVTLASLGYGDVLPVSDVARGLAVTEVVGGQLYLVVLVARLVGSWR